MVPLPRRSATEEDYEPSAAPARFRRYERRMPGFGSALFPQTMKASLHADADSKE
jgi:hypothetical protein